MKRGGRREREGVYNLGLICTYLITYKINHVFNVSYLDFKKTTTIERFYISLLGCVCVLVCLPMWKLEVDAQCLTLLLTTLFFKQCFTAPGAHCWLHWLLANELQAFCSCGPSPHTSAGITGVYRHAWFHMGAGNLNPNHHGCMACTSQLSHVLNASVIHPLRK